MGLDKGNLRGTISVFSSENALFEGSRSNIMALKIRLARIGTRHLPVYRVVVAEARSRRDGAAVEQIGTYHPKQSDVPLKLRLDRVDYWVNQGAVPTATVRSLIKKARKASPVAAATAD